MTCMCMCARCECQCRGRHLANDPPRIDPDAQPRAFAFLLLPRQGRKAGHQRGIGAPYRLFHPARAALAPCDRPHCDPHSRSRTLWD